MEKKKLIEFKNIVKSFDGQIVLKGVNLDIYENEFVTLLGPSGCGKTTLLRILGGFLDADEGQVIFDGEEISQKPASEVYIEYLKQNLPADAAHLLYMDCGDCAIDSAYAESQAAINEFLAGWEWSKANYMYRFFPGQSHSESDWRSRLDIPVKFLLGKDE